MNNICEGGRIWDLHIHSCRCTKPDRHLASLTVSDYVDSLLSLFAGYELLDMVSFTDHNSFSLEVYEEFISRETRVRLLPGIEIDMKLEEDGSSKHLVAYFDCMDDPDLLRRLAVSLNALMREYSVTSENPILIETLLVKLLDIGIPFVVSPHAMKQRSRAIDWDMHALPKDQRGVSKYVDQFFCFWETSGQSQVAHVVKFLKEMDAGERVSVVAFSDSNNLDKLKDYLDHPHQFFHALPSFNGLKMVGSEYSRITPGPDTIDESDLGGYIGTVTFEGESIPLSTGMNAIIGGRGSGKSVLLDSIARQLGLGSWPDADRRNFVDSFNCALCNKSGNPITPGSFRADYYRQNYVASLFGKTGDSYARELEKYFQAAFAEVGEIDVEEYRSTNLARFRDEVDIVTPAEGENISGLVEKLTSSQEDGLSIRLLKSMRKTPAKDLAEFDYEAAAEKMRKRAVSAAPKFLRGDTRFLAALDRFVAETLRVANSYRREYLEGDYLTNAVIDAFFAKKASISEANQSRQKVLSSLESTIASEASGMVKRASIIRAFLRVSVGFETTYEESAMADGELPGAFLFKRTLTIQHPLSYLIEKLDDYILNGDMGGCTPETLSRYVDAFCFDETCYKSGKSWESLYEDLYSFALRYELVPTICYRIESGEYEDIRHMSPGTQANILIEYIVNRDTEAPLLIDQPEDNVDNKTIYGDITRWFKSLKRKRQVIVVTHDANIVINADAENVIIADQPKHGTFCYRAGALEYRDTIDRASIILDGGRDAVRRRLVKYGE